MATRKKNLQRAKRSSKANGKPAPPMVLTAAGIPWDSPQTLDMLRAQLREEAARWRVRSDVTANAAETQIALVLAVVAGQGKGREKLLARWGNDAARVLTRPIVRDARAEAATELADDVAAWLERQDFAPSDDATLFVARVRSVPALRALTKVRRTELSLELHARVAEAWSDLADDGSTDPDSRALVRAGMRALGCSAAAARNLFAHEAMKARRTR